MLGSLDSLLEKSISVGDLNARIRDAFYDNPFYTNIYVFGEVSSFKISNGNAYFTLKDKEAAIACTIWKVDSRATLEEGTQNNRPWAGKLYAAGIMPLEPATYRCPVNKPLVNQVADIPGDKIGHYFFWSYAMSTGVGVQRVTKIANSDPHPFALLIDCANSARDGNQWCYIKQEEGTSLVSLAHNGKANNLQKDGHVEAYKPGMDLRLLNCNTLDEITKVFTAGGGSISVSSTP